jgi:PAS domain S-box-containing protein
MLGFGILAIVWTARAQRLAVERGAIETARALLNTVDREIASTTMTLQVLATSQRLEGHDLRAYYEELERVLPSRTWTTIVLASPDGRQVLNLARPYGSVLPRVADPAAVERVVRTRRPVVSDVQLGPITREHFVGVGVPVVRRGAVEYVLMAALPLTAFDALLAGQRVPGEFVVSILDSRHVHVARSRNAAQYAAQQAAPPLVAALERTHEGFMSSRTLEGQAVYASFSRDADTGWSVAIGIPAEAVDAPLRRSILSLIGGATFAAAGAVLLALWIGRRVAAPMAALAAAAPALVRGHRGPLPDTAVTEVGVLADALAEAGGERARAEAELARTARLLNAVFDGTTDAVYVKDLEGRYVMINEPGARLIGRTATEVVGKDDLALFAPETARRIVSQDRQVLREGAPLTLENVDAEASTGVVRTYLSTKAPYRDADGRVVGLVGITRDITARKRAEEERARALEREQAARAEAEVANRTKDEFLAMLSHELRTPLNAVYGWARMLRTRALDPSASIRALEVIERNARAQTQLIDDLLDISRIVTGKMRLAVRPVSIGAVIDAAADAVRPAADARGLVLAVLVDPTIGIVMGDPDRLQQVVWNLLSNAVKFTPRGGRVDVNAGSSGTTVDIVVRDTGVGIPADLLPHVFDRFRQGDSTSTRAHGGLGLGLALVRHLVELHGGTVTAASDGDGKGATFTVTLPAARARVPASVPVSAAEALGPGSASGLDGLRVLVVEDHRDSAELVYTVLTNANAHVRTVSSVADAIAAFARERPDVVVSDLEMPDEDGFALAARIRGGEPADAERVPLVALTAHGRASDRERSLAAGFDMHVAKPIDPAELVAVVRTAVQRAVSR